MLPKPLARSTLQRLLVPAGLVLLAGCASADPDWRGVRLVRDQGDVKGCTLLTILKDDDMEAIRRRAAESGGDTVLLTGSEAGKVPVIDPGRYVVDVYRCGATGSPR